MGFLRGWGLERFIGMGVLEGLRAGKCRRVDFRKVKSGALESSGEMMAE